MTSVHWVWPDFSTTTASLGAAGLNVARVAGVGFFQGHILDKCPLPPAPQDQEW